MTDRPSWNDYFFKIVDDTAARANCTRSKVGAVIVKDNRIVSTGYNGSPAGHQGCLEGHCPRGKLSREELNSGSYDDVSSRGFCTAVHAEMNAILYADRELLKGSTCYVNKMPCTGCMKALMAAQVAIVKWDDKELNLAELDDFPYEVYGMMKSE